MIGEELFRVIKWEWVGMGVGEESFRGYAD